MKKITLIKLGGSVITDKEVAESLRENVVQRLYSEIAKSLSSFEGKIIIGHGQGSFAHRPAAEYGTKQGFTHEKSKWGMVVTSAAVLKIHQRMLEYAVGAGLPVHTYRISNSLVTHKTKKEAWFAQNLLELLRLDLIPLTTGDVIADTAQGCTIWSTDTIFSFLASEFAKNEHDYKVGRVIHASDVPGVFDSSGALIPRITPETYDLFKDSIGLAKGVDITGGMSHKVAEAVFLAQEFGIETQIVSGLEPEKVSQALSGKHVGTLITP